MADPRVLIVEDEPTLLRQITGFLRTRGLVVEGAPAAEPARAVLAGGEVAVMVTDIGLPGGSGIELLRHCREASPDTQVLVITGVPDLPTAEEAVRLGAFDYLEKPVRLAHLKHRVDQALERVRLKTDARAAQAEVQRLNALLARRLEASSEELGETRAQLERAAVLAELGRLTASVCHELGNPLTALTVAAEMLQDNVTKTEQKRMLGILENSAARCGRIIQMLLDARRVGHHVTEPVVVKHAVTQARSELARRLDAARVQLEEALGPGLPPVKAEPQLFVGCVVNLVKNAMEALTQSTGPRRILVCAREADGRVELDVEDTGPGFSEEVLRRGLEPFFTTRAHAGGTGLGLSIVAATARSWNGDIVLANRPGGGARVRLILHAADAEALRRAGTRTARDAAPRLAGRRVLVAEPTPEVMDLVRTALTAAGATVVPAATGAEIVDACRAKLPDALLVDVHSGIDVPALREELARSAPRAVARLIPMATVHRTEALEAWLRGHPGPVLTKPFGVRALVDVLELVGEEPS